MTKVAIHNLINEAQKYKREIILYGLCLTLFCYFNSCTKCYKCSRPIKCVACSKADSSVVYFCTYSFRYPKDYDDQIILLQSENYVCADSNITESEIINTCTVGSPSNSEFTKGEYEERGFRCVQ